MDERELVKTFFVENKTKTKLEDCLVREVKGEGVSGCYIGERPGGDK